MLFACQFCGGELEVIIPAVVSGGGLAFLTSFWFWLRNKMRRTCDVHNGTRKGNEQRTSDT